jgi:hypothetical protein
VIRGKMELVIGMWASLCDGQSLLPDTVAIGADVSSLPDVEVDDDDDGDEGNGDNDGDDGDDDDDDDDAVSGPATEADVLRDIVAGPDGALHFRIVRVIAQCDFGYEFEVRRPRCRRVCAMAGDDGDVCCRFAASTRDTRPRTRPTP